MADLKQGTTVGGNTIWTQGNLLLIPTGNSLSFRGFKVYTENDKPTATDLGFLPAAGGTLTGPVTSNSSIITSNLMEANQVLADYRLGVLRNRSDAYPYFTIAKSDLVVTASSLPAVNTTIGALWMREGHATDPWAGTIRTNISTVVTTTGGTITYIDNRDIDGTVVNRIQLNTDTQYTQIDKNLRVVGVSTLGVTTTGTLSASTITASGAITSSNVGGLNLTATNATIDIGSTSSVGTPSIDFHTSGTNVDYDIRLTANTNSVSLLSTSTIANLNLETTQNINLHTSAASQIRMSRGCVVIRDFYNGNVTISATKKNDADTVGGDLYLGYSNANTPCFTNNVRLEAPLTWKGSKTLVDANGNIIASNLDTNYLPLTGGTVSGLISLTKTNGSIEFNVSGRDILQLNYSTSGVFGVWNQTGSTWSLYRDVSTSKWVVNETGGFCVSGGYLTLLPHQINGRFGAGVLRDHGNGNVTLSASTSASGSTTGGTLYLGFNGTNHYTSAVRVDAPLNIFAATTSTANITTSGELVSTGGYLRTRAPTTATNAHVWFENPNGSERAVIYVGSNGILSMRSGASQTNVEGTLYASANVSAGGSVLTGNGASYVGSDGNVYGPAWGGLLSNYINSTASNAGNSAVDAYKVQSWNAIGSYVQALCSDALDPGNLVAGTRLTPAASDGNTGGSSSSLPGTWVCCSRTVTGGGAATRTGLFRRVG